MFEKPHIEIAADTADGPGMGNTFILFFIQLFNNNFPGSDIKGVPASETREIIFPFDKSSKIFLVFFFSLNL